MATSCTMKRSIVALSLCAIFLMADVQACSLNDLALCLNAVTAGSMPTPGCCGKVAAVDVPCFCNLVKSGNYPPAYISNAVGVPARCGGAAYSHFKGQVCAGHKIN